MLREVTVKETPKTRKTKELFPRKKLGWTDIEKARLFQYVRRGWHKKAEFTENDRKRSFFKKGFLNPISLAGHAGRSSFYLKYWARLV